MDALDGAGTRRFFMRRLFVAAGLAVALAGCASGPVRDVATVDAGGHFGGPVVADTHMPISSRYQNLCEGHSGRWRYGGYRTYGECTRAATVRALY